MNLNSERGFVASFEVLSAHSYGETEYIHEKSKDDLYPGRYSNTKHPECDSKALPLERDCSVLDGTMSAFSYLPVFHEHHTSGNCFNLYSSCLLVINKYELVGHANSCDGSVTSHIILEICSFEVLLKCALKLSFTAGTVRNICFNVKFFLFFSHTVFAFRVMLRTDSGYSRSHY
jgi:hypothetical protein